MIKNKHHVIVVVSVFVLVLMLFPAVSGLELSNNPDIDSQKDFNSEPENNSMLPIGCFRGFHERNNPFRTRLPDWEIFPCSYTASFNIYEENMGSSVVHNEKRVTQKSNLTQHEPIWIDGNNDFTSENGVTNGTGIIEDPYIIEGWEIERRVEIPFDMWLAGIVIKNTSKHFVIRNLQIINPMDTKYRMYANGVTLYNVSNCRIQNISVEAQDEVLTWLDIPSHHGIWIEKSDNIFLEKNTIINYGQGIVFCDTCNIILRNNSFNSNTDSLIIDGNQTMHYVFDIDSSNTINSKKIIYLIGEKNLFFDNSSDIGFLGLVSCINATVKNFTDSELLIANTTNADVLNSDISCMDVCLSFNISVINITVHDALFGANFVDNENSSFLSSTVYNATIGVQSGGCMLIKNLTTHSTFVGVGVAGDNQRVGDSIINAVPMETGYAPIGIAFAWGAENNTIDNTTIIGGGGTYCGIGLGNTEGNTIINCTIKGFATGSFSELGIYFGNNACNNTIVGCNISGWWYGIAMLGVNNNNTIVKNTFYSNTLSGYAYGIHISYRDWQGNIWGYSNNSLIYHNNFIGNDNNVYDDCANFWDYNGVGNYWDNYRGYDNNNDGIGDNPYSIPGGKNVDNYPIFSPIEFMPPEIVSTYPNDDDVDVALNTSVEITFSEPLNRLSVIGNITISAEVEIESYGWSNDNKTLTVVLSSNLSSYTTYNVIVNTSVRDLSQNNLKKTHIFSFRTKDVTPPVANAGLDLGVDEDTVIELNAFLSSDNAGIVNWSWNFIDQGVSVILYGETVNYTFVQPGVYHVALNVSDSAGNWNTTTINITVRDITAPTIYIFSSVDGLITNQNVTLSYFVYDNFDDVGNITVIGPGNKTIYINEGFYIITIAAIDKSNNVALKTVSFTIDKTKPTIVVSGVEDDAYYNTDVTPAIDVTDDNINIVSITLNDNPFTSGTTVSTGDTYVLVVQANDKAGNTANKTITFTIDKTPPTITITESSQTTNKNIFTLHWSSSEDIQYYEISMDGVNWMNVSTDTQHTFTLSKGGNTLYVRGTDLAGNKGTADITVTYQEKKQEKDFIPGFETFILIVVLAGCAILLKHRKKF